ncbi:MAG: hypothetical protein WC553_01570 [Patescibacteria group bacterium]|jgi:hypothetical protein
MNQCENLHKWANSLAVFTFPFDETRIPANGIYLLFEKGEKAHGGRRIVRIGTHTGKDQLRSRLRQHFLTENKDRSIFRKNIGRAFLNQADDEFLEKWELDLTSAAARGRHGDGVDKGKLQGTEKCVSQYIQTNFSFVVIEVENKDRRLRLESRMISTIAACSECRPSQNWFGQWSPKQKIRESGLWLVNELFKTPLSATDMAMLEAEKAQDVRA